MHDAWHAKRPSLTCASAKQEQSNLKIMAFVLYRAVCAALSGDQDPGTVEDKKIRDVSRLYLDRDCEPGFAPRKDALSCVVAHSIQHRTSPTRMMAFLFIASYLNVADKTYMAHKHVLVCTHTCMRVRR